MKLNTLELDRICAFKKATFSFSPGINVLIGANGTGKSHLMKLLYSILKANEKAEKTSSNSPNNFATLLAQKLIAVFRPDPIGREEESTEAGGLGRLVFRKMGRHRGQVRLNSDAGKVKFTLTTLGRLTVLEDSFQNVETSIFIPSREVLAMYEGFVGNYEKRVLSFDETYYDICAALSLPPARGPWPKQFSGLNNQLEAELGGRVREVGGRFYVYNKEEGIIEAHLLAEGLRKLASLFRLLQNQSLTSHGVLFWDEPEANLNPRLVTLIAEILRRLANGGVQVFLATHDYLLSSELSLAAEYPEQSPAHLNCDIRFFCASRAEDGVRVESAATLPQLRENPILKEFAAHYDREQLLFRGS
jgi:energy-coupling factor transporter ATP-binding protein EcfA2